MNSKLINFNWLFFVLLVCVSYSLLYSAWSFYQAKEIVHNNAVNYPSIDRETERNFNKWDLERNAKVSLCLGLIFFILILYVFICIDFSRRKVNGKTRIH